MKNSLAHKVTDDMALELDNIFGLVFVKSQEISGSWKACRATISPFAYTGIADPLAEFINSRSENAGFGQLAQAYYHHVAPPRPGYNEPNVHYLSSTAPRSPGLARDGLHIDLLDPKTRRVKLNFLKSIQAEIQQFIAEKQRQPSPPQGSGNGNSASRPAPR